MIDAEVTKAMLHKDRWMKVMNIIRTDYVRKRSNQKSTVDEIGLNQLIYVPIVESESVLSESPPIVMEGDLNLPFKVDLEDYNPEEYVQVRVLAVHDWGHVDWATTELLDAEIEPTYFDAIVLHFHGGGFMLGSSGESQGLTTRFCRATGYPIFSVDYRLAPQYKFP